MVFKGTVVSFDEARGTGEIAWSPSSEVGPGAGLKGNGAASSHVVAFHCVAVADGTRHVEPGAPVIFSLVPGHYGMPEAAGIIKL
ncbi:MAG: hypothetical protein M1350_00115 [Actinobacteria bacterium]|nr:hypothetical protein [Actinomycetota bacterium]